MEFCLPSRVRSGKLTLSADGVRAFPFLIAFFVISGFRAVSQFPAELAGELALPPGRRRDWPEARTAGAVRKQALVCGLAPALLMTLPVEFAVCANWHEVVLHVPVSITHGGTLLIEAMFWTFDKVPFTCSYFPGRTNLSLLAGFYLYGFTTYSFHLAALERRIETNAALGAVVFTAGAVLLAYAWRRKPPATQLRFDGEEPLIRTLDLT